MLTAPPTDRSMWRRLLRLTHPDAGGEHELFIWTQALFEHVAGDTYEDERTSYQRHEPPPHPTAGERIDYSAAFEKAESFADLTAQAVAMAERVDEPYARLLRLLADCYETNEADIPGYRAQHQGATYKQLAFIAHLAGMASSERTRWYRVAEEIPLAQRHAGHLIKALHEEAA